MDCTHEGWLIFSRDVFRRESYRARFAQGDLVIEPELLDNGNAMDPTNIKLECVMCSTVLDHTDANEIVWE